MNDILGITDIGYMSFKEFEKVTFEHVDARIMDKFTKVAVHVALDLFKRVNGTYICSERLGVVLATKTGPYESINELHCILDLKGYIGINPSMFPNIMLNTVMARVAIALQAKGPPISMFIRKDMKQAIDYAVIQILKDTCDAMMVLFVDEGQKCFALFIEKKKMALCRGVAPRFMLNY